MTARSRNVLVWNEVLFTTRVAGVLTFFRLPFPFCAPWLERSVSRGVQQKTATATDTAGRQTASNIQFDSRPVLHCVCLLQANIQPWEILQDFQFWELRLWLMVNEMEVMCGGLCLSLICPPHTIKSRVKSIKICFHVQDIHKSLFCSYVWCLFLSLISRW